MEELKALSNQVLEESNLLKQQNSTLLNQNNHLIMNTSDKEMIELEAKIKIKDEKMTEVHLKCLKMQSEIEELVQVIKIQKEEIVTLKSNLREFTSFAR
jgi:hypothetical protein